MSQFATRKTDPGSRDTQNRRLARLSREAHLLDPQRAANLAYGILAGLLDDGISYADFQAAQHAEKSIRKAANLLANVS